MVKNILLSIAKDRKYQLALSILFFVQISLIVLFLFDDRNLGKDNSGSAMAFVVDTVRMALGDTAKTRCVGGKATYQVSGDNKSVEVFCDPNSTPTPQPTATPEPTVTPSPSSQVSPSPTPSASPSPSPSPSPTISPTPSSTASPSPASLSTPENFKVAFIGDTGGISSQYKFTSVLDLIVSEGAKLVLHQGDMGYDDSATQWEQAVIEHLDVPTRSVFPYFMSDGNHDSWSDYETIVKRRTSANGLGTPPISSGGNYTFTYQGLKIVFNKEGGDTSFTQQSLANDQHIWKVCSWHHNRNDFQPGGKSDDVALETFQACLDAGAIIAMGHEHSYSRSCTITNFKAPNLNYGANCGTAGQHTINPGQSSFFFVSGNGGNSLRDYHAAEHDDDAWWNTIYTSNRYCKGTCTKNDLSGQDKSRDISPPSAEHGVTFIVFNVDGDPRKAYAYHKLIDGTIIDSWTIYSQN